jgi:tetratricopeptide (TPR) repeat protein
MKLLLPFAVLVIFISGSSNQILAQCKDMSASASPEIIEKWAIFEDAHTNKKFGEARAPLKWLLDHSPNLTTNLYIKAAEVYDALAGAEKNPEKRRPYVDSLMIIYDLRVKNCGEEANVANRKAFSFFKHYYDHESKKQEILPLMDRAIELNGDKVLDGLVEYYMRMVKIAADKKLIDEKQIFERFDKISAIIDSKIKKAEIEKKPVDRYKKWNEENFVVLASIVNINCEVVRTKLGPEFKKNPSNINLAKSIFNFMLKDKCTDDPLWLQAAEALHAAEKDFGLAKVLAMRYLSTKEYDKGNVLLNEALELASTAQDKADVIGLQAQQQLILGNKEKARELYLKALSIDPSKKEFYARIGDMYLNSFDECAQEKSQADDRLVFLVAYDMYEKAGDNQKMATAKSRFPSRTEIFEANYQRGDKIKLGTCWINEETILRTRD